MKRIMLLTGFLFTICILSYVTGQEEPNAVPAPTSSSMEEPNAVPAPTSLSMEERLLAMEQRLDAVEDRVSQLENSPRRRPVSKSDNDPNRDNLRIERLSKKIQEAEDAIKILDTKLDTLFRIHIKDKPLKEQWEFLIDVWKLLSEKERNLSTIADLAQRYPDLGIDAVAAKQDLVACHQQKLDVAAEKQHVYDEMQDSKRKYVPTQTQTTTPVEQKR